MESVDKKRQQLTDVLGINISPARCATYLKQYLINEEVENKIKSLREKLKNHDPSVDVSTIKSEIATLSQNTIRLSSETSTVMAVICNGFIEDLLKHSIDEAITNNKKIVDITNITSGNHKNNLYYSIYYKLPSFINYNQKLYDDQKKERQELLKKNKKSKETTNNTTEQPNTETTTDTSSVPTPTPVESSESEVNKTSHSDSESNDAQDNNNGNKITFNTYIDAVLKTIKKDPHYEAIKIRISGEVRDYLSTMIIEAIKRFVVLSKIIVQQIMGVRTMNYNHIKAIIHIFMKDEGNSDEQINKIIQIIDSKLKIYHEHIKADRANKFNELDEAAKKAILDKRAERVKIRKQRAVQLAEKRAIEAAAKVKQLTEELTN